MNFSYNIFSFDSVSLISDEMYLAETLQFKFSVQIKGTLHCLCNETGKSIRKYTFVTKEYNEITDPDKCLKNFLNGDRTEVTCEKFNVPDKIKINTEKIDHIDLKYISIPYRKELEKLGKAEIGKAVKKCVVKGLFTELIHF